MNKLKMVEEKHTAEVMLGVRKVSNNLFRAPIIAIGASTGGTKALEQILSALPQKCAPILVVQHMPDKFTDAYVSRLNEICRIEVRVANDGDKIESDTVLLAPGTKHMIFNGSGLQASVELKSGPPISRHKPSVDVLFHSVARRTAQNAMGIILTGMGDDGASGLKEMFDNGAITIGQNRESCEVYGMPKAAQKLGALRHELGLSEIANAIAHHK